MITVADARVDPNPDGSLTAPLIVTIRNESELTLTRLEPCGGAGLIREDVILFGVGRVCSIPTELMISPGERRGISMEATAQPEAWGDPVDGEYALSVMLFVEGRRGAEPFRSRSFLINRVP